MDTETSQYSYQKKMFIMGYWALAVFLHWCSTNMLAWQYL